MGAAPPPAHAIVDDSKPQVSQLRCRWPAWARADAEVQGSPDSGSGLAGWGLTDKPVGGRSRLFLSPVTATYPQGLTDGCWGLPERLEVIPGG